MAPGWTVGYGTLTRDHAFPFQCSRTMPGATPIPALRKASAHTLSGVMATMPVPFIRCPAGRLTFGSRTRVQDVPFQCTIPIVDDPWPIAQMLRELSALASCGMTFPGKATLDHLVPL